MLNAHDAALLRDLKLQPVQLCWAYVMIGLVASVSGWTLDGTASKALCIGGGFLIALGAEKLVTRRIRQAALQLAQSTSPQAAHQ